MAPIRDFPPVIPKDRIKEKCASFVAAEGAVTDGIAGRQAGTDGIRKTGTAVWAFDWFTCPTEDERHKFAFSPGEDRKIRELVVCHYYRGSEKIRIISARKADKKEALEY